MRQGAELSKRRHQEGLGERKRLLFIFLPPTPFFFLALVPSTFPRLMCSCEETPVLQAKNTGVTGNALLLYY